MFCVRWFQQQKNISAPLSNGCLLYPHTHPSIKKISNPTVVELLRKYGKVYYKNPYTAVVPLHY